jgi:hypothetical protein
MHNLQKGIGLVLALLILALLSLLVAAMLTAVTVEVWVGDNFRTEAQLVYLTEAGIEEGREALSVAPVVPPAVPFIRDEPLFDTTGRDAGRYALTVVRAEPLTLRSSGVLGTARRTVEVRLKRAGFPPLPDAVTLNEDIPLPAGVDLRLQNPETLERIVDGIVRNATDVYNPAVGTAVTLGPVGSPSDYRVVVVQGDCELEGGPGYGILLVRGELGLNGTPSWNGLVLVIGQGVMRATPTTTAWISGAVFVTRTRAGDRAALNPLGTLLASRGPVTFEIPDGSLAMDHNPVEMDLANRRFPYIRTTYREY